MKRILLMLVAFATILGASAKVTETTWKDLTKDLKSQKTDIAVVDVYATWCGPCKTYAPTFDAVSEQFPAVSFYRMDIDKNMGITDYIAVKSVPMTIIFYRVPGEKQPRVLSYPGVMSKEDLTAMVEKAKSVVKGN